MFSYLNCFSKREKTFLIKLAMMSRTTSSQKLSSLHWLIIKPLQRVNGNAGYFQILWHQLLQSSFFEFSYKTDVFPTSTINKIQIVLKDRSRFGHPQNLGLSYETVLKFQDRFGQENQSKSKISQLFFVYIPNNLIYQIFMLEGKSLLYN